MAIHTTYTDARAHLAELMDKAIDDRETIVISRRGCQSVALIAEDELTSLQETVYLLRSPNNARRLFDALDEAHRGQLTPTTVEALRREYRLPEDDAE